MLQAIATVVLPVYNAELYLKEAIESVLDQTFRDFNLLVINDGSTDQSENIIKSFDDHRIKYINHDANRGLIAALNEGLTIADTKYIIRMDADDLSLPDRFEKQIAFMESNLDIAISGTYFSVIGKDETVIHPVSDAECRVTLLQNTVLGHPTIILRREAIITTGLKYDENALYAEDYKFWAQASASGLKIANIPEVLLHYRSHSAQISAIKIIQQFETVRQIRIWYAQQFFYDLIKNKFAVYIDLLNATVSTFVSFVEAKALVKALKYENQLKQYFDTKLFENFFDSLLKKASFRIYVLCVDCNTGTLFHSFSDPHFYSDTNIFQKARFVWRSLQR